MKFLDRLEDLLEGLIEGVFGHKSTDLPVLILKHLAEELKKKGKDEGGVRWAPSEYHIILTREAMRAILPIRAELEEELQHAVKRLADRFGMTFPGPLRFRFGIGDGEGMAVISVTGSFSPLPPLTRQEPWGEFKEATGPTKIYRRPSTGYGRAWLRVESGPDAGREFQLTESKTLIGRELTAHVLLRDLNVSRRHATITFCRGDYVLADLGSTNGTMVNGRAVKRHRLQPGDVIRLGSTTMVFHRERGGGN